MLELKDGTKINYRITDHGASKWLVVTHGIGEHLARNNFFGELKDYNIFQYDLRGHGKSEGKRAFAESIDQYVLDLEHIIQFATQDGKPHALFGHSMGALITASLVQQKKSTAHKIFLSSPPAALPGGLGRIVSVLPTMLFSTLRRIPLSVPLGGMVDVEFLSHNRDVIDTYISDELNSMKLHSKLLLSLVESSKKVFSKPLNCSVPLYCIVGSEDGIVSPKAVTHYFTKIETTASLKVIQGGYHELHNDSPEYNEPYQSFLRESL